jgi:hypothetical protein
MHRPGKAFVRQCGIEVEKDGMCRFILSCRSDQAIDGLLWSVMTKCYLIASKQILTSACALFVLMVQVKCFDEVQLERK